MIDNIECCVCYELTTDVLQCNHSLCHICIERMFDNRQNTCPLCRKEFVLNKELNIICNDQRSVRILNENTSIMIPPGMIQVTHAIILFHQTLICESNEFGFEILNVHPVIRDVSIIQPGDIIINVDNQRLLGDEFLNHMHLHQDRNIRCQVLRDFLSV